jgi:hypothetical protein
MKTVGRGEGTTTMYLVFASQRARKRVETLLGRPLVWACGNAPRDHPRAFCSVVTADEWAVVQQHRIPSMHVCPQGRYCLTRDDTPDPPRPHGGAEQLRLL